MMISREMMSRLRTAAGYQKQAVRALLPKGMEGHLDVIEKEVKLMLAETVTGLFSECVSDAAAKGGEGEERDKGIKKVTIE